MISAVIEFEDGSVSIHTSKTKNVNTKFNSGWYEAYYDSNGNLRIKTENIEELHEPYKSKENDLIIKTVDGFFKKGIRESVEKMGFTHKLGVLMFGKQGTGKSSIMNSVSKRMIDKNNAIVIYCNNYSTLEGGISLAKKIRQIQDNPILFIADEFDIYVRDMESTLKNFLDGKDSISNSLFLAATNYIDRIPNTLKERPSRFKLVLEIFGIDDKKIMYNIMKKISDKLEPNLFTDEELKKLFVNVDSITIDELKQMALDKLTETILPKNKKQKIGFIINKDNEDEDDDVSDDYDLSTPLPSFGDEQLSNELKTRFKRLKKGQNDSDSNI